MTASHEQASAPYRAAGKLFLEANGWKLEGAVPHNVPKAVIIAAPHTSSWDIWFMLSVAGALGIKLSWFGRKGMFEGPWGGWLSALGGIPIDRSTRNGAVRQAVDAFERQDNLWLLIAPEGRLERTDYWKSGFYHIAYNARVPLACSFLDFERKIGGLGPVFDLTGNVREDMDKVRAFYATIAPKNRAKFGPIRLKDEELGERISPLA